MAASGALSGSNFAVSALASVYQVMPGLAYDPVNDTYLAVWHDRRSGSYDVYGQLIGRDGALSGGNFAVYAGGYTQEYAEAAANTGAGGYLAGWRDTRDEFSNVYGRRVSGAGQTQGDAFAIGPVTPRKQYPWAAFNAAAGDDPSAGSGQALLVWEDYRDGNADVYGQRLGEDGQPAGDNFRISDAAAGGDQLEPRAAAAGAAGWLVVWGDTRTGSSDIYPQGYRFAARWWRPTAP